MQKQLTKRNMLQTIARASSMVLLLALTSSLFAQHSRFATTDSRSQYVHWIELRDVDGKTIDPADPKSPPYSPAKTCGKCHDYEGIAKGHHFNAVDKTASVGRPGEPWIWTDIRTGTQIPLSYRAWSGTYRPEDLHISAWQFTLKFGQQLPDGGPSDLSDHAEPTGSDTSERWQIAGALEIDCLLCHSNDRSYAVHLRAGQIGQENLAWAPTVAAGLADVEGSVKRLPDDFDPSAPIEEASTGPKLPRTVYRQSRFIEGNKVFFDVVRQPANNACYHCHTTRPVGEEASPDWTRDEDVHVEAGLSCSDCHRNGLEHHTVRGFEMEQHPTGQSVVSYSCRGCHLGGNTPAVAGGHFAAPRPLHKGLPPLHLEKMSCTSCHAGPVPTDHAQPIQTSLAHELGTPAHRDTTQAPQIVSSVLLKNDNGVLYPYRMMWPAFWGLMKNDRVIPLNPDEAYTKLRRVLRVRRDFSKEIARVRLSSDDKSAVLGADRANATDAELSKEEKAKLDKLLKQKATDAFQEKLASALQTLGQEETIDGVPVYISSGKAYRLKADGGVETFEHPAAKPYVWPLAHDVRPASQSLGIHGCTDCHSDSAAIFYGRVTALGPAPDNAPVTSVICELQGFDPELLAVWSQSFRGRTAFKWFGFVAVGVVTLVLLLYVFLGLNGLLKLAKGKRS